MTTVILAGGASRRMGRDKAMLPFRGKTLLQYLVDRYSEIGRVLVSVNIADRFPVENAEIIVDRFPGAGPMNGIVSGFSQIDDEHLFLTATDLPYGDPQLALRLESLIDEHDVCLIDHGTKYETLFGVYSRNCLSLMENSLENGQNSMKRLFDKLSLKMVGPEAISDFDVDRILMNVNTEEDYKKILEIF